MKCKNALCKDCNWILVEGYPSICHTNCSNYRVILGIGGNIGDTPKRFQRVLSVLNSRVDIKICQTSPILKNPPFGYIDQEYFYNAIVEISTKLSPIELLKRLWFIEKRFGRVRTFQDAPRTLDIDIILYDNRNLNFKRLKIPHRGYRSRDSVLLPLCSLKGDLWSKRHLWHLLPKRRLSLQKQNMAHLVT